MNFDLKSIRVIHRSRAVPQDSRNEINEIFNSTGTSFWFSVQEFACVEMIIDL